MQGLLPASAHPDEQVARAVLEAHGLAAVLRRGATEDAYRAGYLAGIRAVASLGQLLPGAARPPQEPGE